jgi:hypothetical protein
MPMQRRDDVHRAYWHLAAERQRIFERRVAGASPPWTEDEILARYKFTNPWRASDRVSQFLIGEVIYGAEGLDLGDEDVLLRIVLFRLFSRPATWRALEAELGPRLATRTVTEWVERLRAARVPAGPVHDIEQAFAFAEGIGLAPVDATGGVATVRPPYGLSETPATVRLPPPALGEHDGEIRRWLTAPRTSRPSPGGSASGA